MRQPYEWDGDWSAITDEEERRQLDRELQRELCPGHILYGVAATAIGRWRGRDDTLFRLPDGRIAQVHLTWKAETDPRWPWAEIYAGFDDWKAVPPEDR